MRTPAAPFVLLLVLLGACGGGSGGGTPGGGTLPPTQPPPQQDGRVNTDPAGSELSLFPSICCDGPKLYVAWYDRRDGNLDVYFNRSLDGGATWLAQDIRLDTDPPGAALSVLPQVVCSGTRVYVVWYDERDGQPDIRFNRSLDSGLTWLAQDVRLDTDAAGAAASRDPTICCDGARVYVAWHDDRDGSWDIRFNRSLDSGATWLPADVRIDRDAGATDARFVRLACGGTTVAAAWSDERLGGTSVLFSRSLDSGATWPAMDVVLDDAASAGIPRVAVAGTSIHVVWTDVRAALPQIRYNRSTNVGVDWLAEDVRVDAGDGGASNPDLCATGGDLYVVWQDGRNGEADVYLQRTRDAGATWFTEDVRLDRDLPGVSTSWDPRVCCDGQDVHVVWRDDRHGRFDIFLRHSGDRGATWSVPEVRLDTDAPGAAHSVAPEACCAGPFVGVAWMDDRHATADQADIYGNKADFAPGP